MSAEYICEERGGDSFIEGGLEAESRILEEVSKNVQEYVWLIIHSLINIKYQLLRRVNSRDYCLFSI